MSTVPTATEEGQRSSVKLVRNAKGDTQIEVKVYVGDGQDLIDEARNRAVSTYRTLEREFYGSGVAA